MEKSSRTDPFIDVLIEPCFVKSVSAKPDEWGNPYIEVKICGYNDAGKEYMQMSLILPGSVESAILEGMDARYLVKIGKAG